MTPKQSFTLTALVAALSATPAMAHHSGVMFDHSKTVEITGVVREFGWNNPHAHINIPTIMCAEKIAAEMLASPQPA